MRYLNWIFLLLLMLPSGAESASLFDGNPEVLYEAPAFTEGPAVNKQGKLFFTDLKNSRILELDPEGNIQVFRKDSGGANGLYFRQDGTLVVCEGKRQRLVEIRPDDTTNILAATHQDRPFNKPNDLWIDPKGGIYFSDPAYGLRSLPQDGEHVYYLPPDRSKPIRVTHDLKRPNGLIGTPDGKRLYIADPGAETIWRFDVTKSGRLTNKTFFSQGKCDGMTLDQQGRLYTTHENINVHDRSGTLIESLPLPMRATNVTFGGEDSKTLFITARNYLLSIQTRTTGAYNWKKTNTE